MCASFRPVPRKWVHPKSSHNISMVLLYIMKNITGSYFKPISPVYLLNENCSSQYYFSGSSESDYMNNGWFKVTTESLLSRYKDTIWTSDDRSGNIRKIIRIKFSCGGSAAEFVYPIFIVATNLSKEEFPNDRWLVIRIKGLSINGHILEMRRLGIYVVWELA